MELLPGTSEWRMVKCLLLCLFFTSGEADCPIPQGRDVLVLTDEALLKNSFPEGSQAAFECTNGYLPEAGSGTVTCMAGQWSDPELTCKKKDCGPPKPQPNMSFEYIDGGTLFGAAVRVVCDKGYQVSGPAYKQCYANGWTGRPRCEVVTCDKPAEITSGRNSWITDDDPEYGDIVHYFCDEGYTLAGNAAIACNEDGEYSPQPPRCEAVPVTVGTTPSTHTDQMTTTRDTSTSPLPITGGATTTDSVISSTNHTDHVTTTGATSITPPSIQGEREEVDVNKQTGNTAVIASVIGTVTVVLIVLYILHRCHVKRKGSYDTGEDLKPELLQFESL